MPIKKDFKETIVARAKEDKEFRQHLLVHGFMYLMLGRTDEDVLIGKSTIRDYINATIGFKKLAQKTKIGDKTLMQMFGKSGNPSQKNLNAIFRILLKNEGMTVEDLMPEPFAEAA
jgi:DNA-binding phage protein